MAARRRSRDGDRSESEDGRSIGAASNSWKPGRISREWERSLVVEIVELGGPRRRSIKEGDGGGWRESAPRQLDL